MKVADSLIQTTQLVQFDKKLNYYNPNLYIITHKDAPALKDIKKQKRMVNLEAYLNAKRNPINDQPTGSNLSLAESNF